LRHISQERLGIGAIRRYLVDENAVDQVFQDVLVAVATSVSSYAGRAAFTTWLYSVATNQAKLFLRTQSRRAQPVDPHEIAEGQWTQAAVSDRLSSQVAFQASMNDMLAELPESYRTAVVLRDIEKLSYAEIATELAIEVNTVRSRIHRGRALLAASFVSARAALDQ